METRRTFVRGLGLAAGVALAGCSSGGGSDSSGDGDSGSGGDGSDGGETESSDGGSGSEWTETSTVEMTDELAYEPKKIQVEAGTTVTFENVGSIGHTVTAYEDEIPDGADYFASGGFDSLQAAKDGYSNGQEGNIPKGESYEVTLETTGTYEYYCIPHEMNGMVGTIKVV
ncbi:plastocyanin/azurin family copper-binding protein [Haloarcula sp. KBTZ06]|uniref:Copper-binding protein n=1 Tax=Haloarcula hispanica TaxID=51589 RepID=A0A482T2R3_HALHI|nr:MULTISPECIES: plastocyanin/azurin family copper-binding protein [Haloarcula]AJF26762.1 copper-binding protein [Haloarcula sp. CBA1115]MCJ0618486.1 copper-binding protein [Haloarcula hispanica]MUV48429.1 copper-binding protein [Haloarcula sp. CBA1122]RYJ09080.1 copper-binding protein [Haloarcula hispanica]